MDVQDGSWSGGRRRHQGSGPGLVSGSVSYLIPDIVPGSVPGLVPSLLVD